jgi:hypothetical protein
VADEQHEAGERNRFDLIECEHERGA